MKRRELSGMQFGRITVLNVAYIKKGHKYYNCVCECGNAKVISGSHLASGASKSCGCMVGIRNIERFTTHGQSKSRLYRIWRGIKNRCLNPNDTNYPYYGGRGITISDEWLNNFEAFQAWSQNNGYDESLTIDRIDVNGNYEPNNCRWVNRKVQARNKRDNHLVTINGITKYITDWVEESPVSLTTIYQRIRDGWTVEDAILITDRRKERRK